MSPARRCCFIASLLLCVLAVIGFVWLVPCSESGQCPAGVDRVKTHNWLNNYTKIELKGGVNVVSGLRNWENNLIFLYRGDAFFPEFRPGNTKRNGIISLIGSSGAVAWYDEMVDEPVAIDCTLLDVDRNGRADCLVIDEYGELGAINPISGQWHWRFKERSAHKVDALDFPVILPDLDGDGVLDILVVTSGALEQRTKNSVRRGELKPLQNGERNYLRILSGRSGEPIGEGFQVHDCDVLRKLQLENTKSQTITFNCLRNNTEATRSKTLAELFALITNKSLMGVKLTPTSKIAQHRHYGQRKDIDAQRNIYSLSGRELVVENRGKCPDDCNVTFILSESNRNGQTNVIRNFTTAGMYGMVPAQWHFKNTKTKMSGFVMKFWKWNNLRNTSAAQFKEKDGVFQKSFAPATVVKKPKGANAVRDNVIKPKKQNQTQFQSNKTKKSRRRRRKRSYTDAKNPTSQFDAFDHLIQKRQTYSIPSSPAASASISERIRVTRSSSTANMTTKQQLLLNENYKMQMITETVILVLFIGADTQVENTSQSDIVQFCQRSSDQSTSELVCQPDLNNQENSMLIADLDQDGSQELVSYMSTFVQASDDSHDWKLVTYVRLLRLQSELPAFYEQEKRH